MWMNPFLMRRSRTNGSTHYTDKHFFVCCCSIWYQRLCGSDTAQLYAEEDLHDNVECLGDMPHNTRNTTMRSRTQFREGKSLGIDVNCTMDPRGAMSSHRVVYRDLFTTCSVLFVKSFLKYWLSKQQVTSDPIGIVCVHTVVICWHGYASCQAAAG